MKKKSTSLFLNIAFVALLLAILLVPAAKALLITGLMKLGMFTPSVGDTPLIAPIDRKAINFRELSGRDFNLGSLTGKVVFLNFWATWCPPCLAEMPSIEQLHKRFEKDTNVVFLMVDADGNLNSAQQFMQRKNYKLPVHEATSNIPDGIFDGTLPTTLIFNKKGEIVFKETGAADYASKKMMGFLEKLSKE